jgi:Carboxypeptidase regulatory-like domain
MTGKDFMDERALKEAAPLEQRLSVFGTVTDSGISPVSQAVVTLADMAGRKIGSAYSDHAGHYRLDTATGGTYLLIASAPGHEPIAALVAVGDQSVRHDVILTGAGGLFGRVRLAGTAAAPSAEPVSGATVTVIDVRGDVLGTVATAGDGSFSFPHLPKGTYTLMVAAAGHQPVAIPVTVVQGEPTHHEVELVVTGSLHGGVEVHDTPFEDAAMTLQDETGRVVAEASSDASGRFFFADLQPGEYTLVATGYSPTAVPVQVVDGKPTRADITVGGNAL